MFNRPPASFRRKTQAKIRATEPGPRQLKHQEKHLHGIAPRLGIYSGDGVRRWALHQSEN
jgi:hypothetical protein